MTKYTEASLFDLDQTLLTENSSYSFGSYLYEKQVISLASMLYCVGCYSLHKIGKLSLSGVHEKIFKSLFFGHSQERFKHLAVDFVEDNLSRMQYLPAIQRLDESRRKGQFTVILSSSPAFIVHLIAKKLGVHEYLATEYEIDKDGKFVSVGHVLDGEGKARFLQGFSSRICVEPINITAYTDSILDMPLLMQVGTAVGVNPDNKLRAVCVKKGWEII